MFQSIRNFIFKAILATLFFLASALIFISLISYSKNDPGFGKFEKTVSPEFEWRCWNSKLTSLSIVITHFLTLTVGDIHNSLCDDVS